MSSPLSLFYSVVFAFYLNGVSSIPSVPSVTLNDGKNIPAIALGTWLGHAPQGSVAPKGDEIEKAVEWAIDAGYRHIDTAYRYKIEDQVGRALNKKFSEGVKREEVFITTKLWNAFHQREAVVPSLRESMELLNLEYVDLYLIHWPIGQFDNKTFDYTDYLDTWRGMIDAKNLGLTKSIGVSNFNVAQLQRIIDSGLETPAVLQVELNLNLQQPSLLSYCKSKNITVEAYTPFGSLFKGRAAVDAPPPRSDDPALVQLAQKYNKTVPQIALRFLVELGVIPLPKSIHKNRIEENLNIFDFTLAPEEFKLLQNFDKGYRTLPQLKFIEHPYYPFKKTTK